MYLVRKFTCIEIQYHKVTFFAHMINLCEIVKMGLLVNLCDFYVL